MPLEIAAPRVEYRVNPMGLDRTHPRFSWEYAVGSDFQSSYRIVVCNERDEVVWDSGVVANSQQNQIAYGGQPLESHHRYRWRVEVTDQNGDVSFQKEDAFFDTGFLEPWQPRLVLHRQHRLAPTRLFRRLFQLDSIPQVARLYASAHGCCDMRINGRAVSGDFFTPGWTDYHKRLHYRCWEVTDLLRAGDNCLAAELSDGWYAGPIGWGQARYIYGENTGIIAALHVRFADGSESWIEGDEHWRSCASATLSANFLNGERHDATLTNTGWDQPIDPPGDWQPVELGDPASPLSWHPGEPVLAHEGLPCVAWWQPRPGSWIADFGRNIAGICRLRVEAPPGTIIRLRFAEVLTTERALYTDNMRTAEVTDEYVCRGEGMEQWQPKFTYHGFRYVEVTGLTDQPNDDTLVAIPLWSDCPDAGEVACSEPMIEQLARNATWTQRANHIDIPTDCPQRDERLGWTGDIQAYIRTSAWFHDVASFHSKWLLDLDDATSEDGRAPCVAPRVPVCDWDADAAWGDATTVCPWTIYQVYNDRDLLERYYPLMKRYVSYYRQTCNNGSHTRSKREKLELNDGRIINAPIVFGDWLSVDAETAPEIIMTAFYACSVMLTARAAKVLGEDEEAQAFGEEWEAISKDFNRDFVDKDGRIIGITSRQETQTAYCLALHFDLLPPEQRPKALAHLVADIERRNEHLSTGFVGLPYLLPVLARFGRSDLAYRLLLKRTYPSWGYEIEHGATSIWERWNGYHHRDGPGDPNMNSYSHYAYGAVCEWLFSGMVGLEATKPGFAEVRLRPMVDRQLTFANARYRSIRGPIETGWKIEGDWIEGYLNMSANTRTSLQIATKGPIEIDGKVIGTPKLGEDGFTAITLSGGQHRWRYPT